MIGLPGDQIQFKNGELYLNGTKIVKKIILKKTQVFCGENTIDVNFYEEIIKKKNFITVYNKNGTLLNTDLYTVPDNHYFFLGDNRDCSKDSRFLSSVGYVHENNLVGKAQIVFFSNDTKKSSLFKFWNWQKSMRSDRFFKKLKWNQI